MAAGRAGAGGRRGDIPRPAARSRRRAARWRSAWICRSACRAPTRRHCRSGISCISWQRPRMRPDFFQVCATLAEVRPDRPFYPARGVRGMTRAAHAAALGLDGAAALSRACDRATAERPAGAPLFWTLGANQSARRRSRRGRRCCCRRSPTARTSGSGRSPAPIAACWRPVRWRWPRPIPPRRCAISGYG